MTLYHIELILNYKHLQEKTQKQRLHCICKKKQISVKSLSLYTQLLRNSVFKEKKPPRTVLYQAWNECQFFKKNLLDNHQMLLF